MTDIHEKRILTLQVEILDVETAAWIWHSHLHNYSPFGVKVMVINEGPIQLPETEGL